MEGGHRECYQTAMNIAASGSVMGNPTIIMISIRPIATLSDGLMRMTFDYKANEHKMGQHAANVVNISPGHEPDQAQPAVARTQPWTVVPYQSTHNTGGSMMGTNPRECGQQVSAELELP
jgi:gluconate 2-dehydrogenase alpha chain